MPTDLRKALEFLEYVRYMTIAVVQPDGRPWAVPVRIQKRDDLSFYWDSSTCALHSQCIAIESRIMVMMYQLKSEAHPEFGFYGDAIAEVVEALPDGRARYRATVTCAWMNDERHQKRKLNLPHQL